MMSSSATSSQGNYSDKQESSMKIEFNESFEDKAVENYPIKRPSDTHLPTIVEVNEVENDSPNKKSSRKALVPKRNNTQQPKFVITFLRFVRCQKS